ncbi:hypothetical protein, partial [Mycobacterium sp.]|uniref:hypothetical protein n=2 Tax=Mycobacterium sp. TaxID=1785 RepID=UPI003F958915
MTSGGEAMFGKPALQQQGAQQPRIRAVGLGALLGPAQRRHLGRITQMHPHPGGGQLLADIAPPGATLHRELAVTVWTVFSQPVSQRLARRRTNLPPMHQPLVIDIVERNLLSVHVQAAYHRHQWDLLEFLKPFFRRPTIIERLSRGG